MKKQTKYLLIVFTLVLVVGLTSAYFMLKKNYELVLVGDESMTIEVFEVFNEPGIEVFINDRLQDKSSDFVLIDSKTLNTLELQLQVVHLF